MAEALTQDQIDAIVARAAETVRHVARDPDFVFELPGTPTQASGNARPDGWCDVGAVVDVPGGRSYLVWWHPGMRRGRLRRGAE
jgi:hypothetical protein